MDQEGVDVAIIFGTRVALSVNGLRDKALAGALCHAVNRWLLEEYLPIDPKRLKGVGLIPCQDPPAAVKELEWLIQHRPAGVVSAMLPVNVYGMNLVTAALILSMSWPKPPRCHSLSTRRPATTVSTASGAPWAPAPSAWRSIVTCT
jgi:hypothetical protein